MTASRHGGVRLSRAAAGALSLVVAVGCSGTTPQPSTPVSDRAGGGPEEIRLDTVDPCAVFDGAARSELRINGEPRAGFNAALRAPACGHPSAKGPRFGYTVSVVTSAGAGTWFTEPDVTAVETRIAGRSAVTFYFGHPLENYGCQLAVDTARGQHLVIGADIPVTAVGGRPSMESMCVDAKRAAELAVGSLGRVGGPGTVSATPTPGRTS